MLWGNARLLVGLVTAAERIPRRQLLAAGPTAGRFLREHGRALVFPGAGGRISRQRHLRRQLHLLLFPGHRRAGHALSRDQGRPLPEAGRAHGRVLHEVRRPADRPQPRQPLRLAGHPRALRDHRQPRLPGPRPGQVESRRRKAGSSGRWAASASTGTSSSTATRGAASRTGCGSISTSGGSRAKPAISTWPSGCWRTSTPTTSAPTAATAWPTSTATPAGPVAAVEKIEEWPFCCSFHGPLGLHFLKALSCRRLRARRHRQFSLGLHRAGQGGRTRWSVSVRSRPDYTQGRSAMEIELAPRRRRRSPWHTLGAGAALGFGHQGCRQPRRSRAG